MYVAFETEWKHFSFPGAGRRRGGMVFAVACRLRTGLSHLPISPSPSSKPVVVRPLICCNLPLQSPCQDRSYFRSSSRLSSVAKQDFKDTKEEARTGEAENTRQEKRLDVKRREGNGQVAREVKKNRRWQKSGARERSPVCLQPYCVLNIAVGLRERGKLWWRVVYKIWASCLVSHMNGTARRMDMDIYFSMCIFFVRP